MAQLSERSDEERRQQERQEGLWAHLQRMSRTLIYSAVMRAGGEPFGAPYEIGVPTLTERVVKKFRQRGFFSFETLERLRSRPRRNKFTRHGAAPYRGAYSAVAAGRSSRGLMARLLDLLRRGGRGAGPWQRRGGPPA